MESKEQNKLTNNRHRLRDTENRLRVARGAVGGLGGKGEGNKKYRLVVTK